MDMLVYEENRSAVLEAFCRGEFDYMEAASEVVETEFFGFIKARSILQELAGTCPTPRRKEEVPLWLYIASDLSMRLHGVHAFHAWPMLVRSGGMLNAFGQAAGRKSVHPQTGDVTLVCEGTNRKNHYQRQTPCDQDFLRKMARDTDAQKLMRWFNVDVLGLLHAKRAIDKAGLFIGDASYLFVPDNPAYEGSVRMLFDEHNHPVGRQEREAMTPAQRERCQWRRCYKLVWLLHASRRLDYFLAAGVAVVSGNDNECPVLYDLVDQAAATLGKGVIKRLILDRGFLDGERIAHCKRDLGIDVLIPLRRNMDIYQDAMALFSLPETRWLDCAEPDPPPSPPPQRPESLRRRESKRQDTLRERRQQQPPPAPDKVCVKSEAAAIAGFTSWTSCTVGLSVVAGRDTFADGHQDIFLLVDTAPVGDPVRVRAEYALRAAIEERHRQWKCFCDLTAFTSRAFSLVVNQIVFTLLAFNLLQFFLMRQNRKDLAGKPPPLIRRQLLPAADMVILYYQHYYALFAPMELVGITARLGEGPRNKIALKCERLHREFDGLLQEPRPP